MLSLLALAVTLATAAWVYFDARFADLRDVLLLACGLLFAFTAFDAARSWPRNRRVKTIRTSGKLYVDVVLNEWDDRPPDGKIDAVTKWRSSWQPVPHDKQSSPLSAPHSAVMRTLLPKLRDMQICVRHGLLRISKIADEPETWQFECLREPLETRLMTGLRAALWVVLLPTIVLALTEPLYLPQSLSRNMLIGGAGIILLAMAEFLIGTWQQIPREQHLRAEIDHDLMQVEWTKHHGYRCGTHHYKAFLNDALGFGVFCQRLLDMQNTVKAELPNSDWRLSAPQYAEQQAKSPPAAPERREGHASDRQAVVLEDAGQPSLTPSAADSGPKEPIQETTATGVQLNCAIESVQPASLVGSSR